MRLERQNWLQHSTQFSPPSHASPQLLRSGRQRVQGSRQKLSFGVQRSQLGPAPRAQNAPDPNWEQSALLAHWPHLVPS